MRKVVQFETFSSIYNSDLQKELLKNETFINEFELEILNLELLKEDITHVYNTSKKYIVSKIWFWIIFNKYLKKRFNYLKGSILHIQYVSRAYIFLFPFIVSTFSSFILSFWGSDLLRESSFFLFMLKPLIRRSKYITFETNAMRDIFENKITSNYSSKIKIVKFGVSILDNIREITINDISNFCDKFKVNSTRKVICVGYNRNPNHQHKEIIKSLIKHFVKREKVFLIFPWTYGPNDDSYKAELIEMLDNHFDYIFIENRMHDKEIACLRRVSDILVQVQTTDSFSSTMLENLYAKNEVLAGSWLPYKELLDLGVKMELTETVDDVGYHLNKMIACPIPNIDRINNAKRISQLSSWEKNIDKWISLYK